MDTSVQAHLLSDYLNTLDTDPKVSQCTSLSQELLCHPRICLQHT